MHYVYYTFSYTGGGDVEGLAVRPARLSRLASQGDAGSGDMSLGAHVDFPAALSNELERVFSFLLSQEARLLRHWEDLSLHVQV
jgi:hypothetical protein